VRLSATSFPSLSWALPEHACRLGSIRGFAPAVDHKRFLATPAGIFVPAALENQWGWTQRKIEKPIRKRLEFRLGLGGSMPPFEKW